MIEIGMEPGCCVQMKRVAVSDGDYFDVRQIPTFGGAFMTSSTITIREDSKVTMKKM